MTEKIEIKHTTKHALERWRERILPRIFDESRKKYLSHLENAERALSSAVNDQVLTPVKDKQDAFHGFFNNGGWLLPIIFIIKNSVLITLWIDWGFTKR